MRPIILCFVAYYLPGFRAGGPLRSISNMVDRLGDELDFRIITRDRDSLDAHSYPSIQVNAWNQVGKAQVFYASPDRLGFYAFARLIRETSHDVLYLNSFFDFSFSIQILIARKLGQVPLQPCVLAPRGEFSKGALEFSRTKKTFFMSVAYSVGIHKCLTWQASSSMELDDIRFRLGAIAHRIVIAPNLPPAPAFHQHIQDSSSERHNGDPLRLVFISRISPKKNLDYLLEALAQVHSPVSLDIFGPAGDSIYFDKCLDLLRFLPVNVHVSFLGELNHADVSAAFGRFDLFAFPTRGENYGHVIHESLAAGTPVLVSDQTPWRGTEDLAVQEISLLNQNDWAAAIDQWANLDAYTKAQRRASALAYANCFFEAEEVMNQNRCLFLNAAKGELPVCAA